MENNGKYHKIEIEQMIQKEENQSQRALLIILNNINQSLIANTEMTKEYGTVLEAHIADYKNHKNDYNEHTKREEEMINKGRGAYKVAGVFFGFIQVALISVISIGWSDLMDIHTHIGNDSIDHKEFKIRLDNVEEDLKNLIKKK